MIQMKGFKDKAILFGWIAGLLIIISMIWIFSQPLQTHNILRTVNSIFMNNNDSRRLSSHIPVKTDKADMLGYWYSMYNSPEMMFVFTIFQDGILIPLGAVVSDDGSVNEIIPLSAHAVQVFSDLPQSILQMYIKRIEAASLTHKKGNVR